MATVVHMPAVLTGVTEAAIATWLVAPGQSVTVGQPLAEIETEKAVVEYASEVEGTVLELLAEEGASVAIGGPIALVGVEGDHTDMSSAPGDEPASPAVGDEPPIPSAPNQDVTSRTPAPENAEPSRDGTPTRPPQERRFVSPLVRRLAHERGIDLSDVLGSGPNGRIVRRDLDVLISAVTGAPEPAPPAAAPESTLPPTPEGAPISVPPALNTEQVQELPLTPMRRAIARRLIQSKTTVPHFYLRAECRVDRLLALRREVNEASDVRVSVNDFVLAATAAALRAVPDANATWGETAIRRHPGVDIAVAVAVDGGLVTPVVRGVDSLRLSEISRTVADLAERARAGRLKQHELEGGTFSVSNLGMYGTQEFAAIINPPHAGILAVGAARRAPIVEEDQLTVGMIMTVTLSADHRVIDGAPAARWLAAFVERIEHPFSLLV